MKEKRRQFKIRIFLCMLMVNCLFAGCGTELSGENTNSNTEVKEQIDFTYQVPESRPYILINQQGYYANSVKTAIFVGNDLPAQFSIIDASTNDEVYTGDIEYKGYNADTEENISIGTFTEFTMEGEYYIVCDIVGQSYHFTIEENIYDEMYNEALASISDRRWENSNRESEELVLVPEESGNNEKETSNKEEQIFIDVSGGWYTRQLGDTKERDVRDGSETMINLLMSYELYLENLNDMMGIAESGNKIPDLLDEATYEALWLLKMQDTKTGGVYAGVLTDEAGKSGLEEISMEATEYFAAAMAKYSYAYKNYDNTFATLCLRAADKALKYMETDLTRVDEDMYFYVCAELYRASGGYHYHAVVKDYIGKTLGTNINSKAQFNGCYTYISTKLYVDKDLCAQVIKLIMEMGEDISADAKGNYYQVNTKLYENGNELLLWNMTVMTVVDYVIGNHEYDTLLENHLHYLMGRNPQAVSYIPNVGNDTKALSEHTIITDSIVDTAAYFFMMNEITDNE